MGTAGQHDSQPEAPPALSAEEWLPTATRQPGITNLIFLLAREVPCIATSQDEGRGARSIPGSRKIFQPAVPGVSVEQPQGQGTRALGGRGRQWDTGQVPIGTCLLWPSLVALGRDREHRLGQSCVRVWLPMG